jgi:hypothetical protein
MLSKNCANYEYSPRLPKALGVFTKCTIKNHRFGACHCTIGVSPLGSRRQSFFQCMVRDAETQTAKLGLAVIRVILL